MIMQKIRESFIVAFHSKSRWNLLQNILFIIMALWAISPEALYYKWSIWATMAALWLIITLVIDFMFFIRLFRRKIILFFVWPLFHICLWLLARQPLQQKYLAISFFVLIYIYYKENKRLEEFSAITVLGIAYYLQIAFASFLYSWLDPNISRDLALGRLGQRNWKATMFLANLHAVYGMVLLSGILFWEAIKAGTFRKYWLIATLIIVSSVIRSGYLYATILSGLLLVIIVLDFFLVKTTTSYKWLVNLFFLLLISGIILIIFPGSPIEKWFDNIIFQIDMDQFNLSEKLLGRISVYFRSLQSIRLSPVIGFGGVAKNEFMVGNHSFLLDTGAKYGIFGLVLFICSHLILYNEIRDSLRPTRQKAFDLIIFVYSLELLINPSYELNYFVIIAVFCAAIWNFEGGKNDLHYRW